MHSWQENGKKANYNLLFFQSDLLPLYFKIIWIKFQMITFKISLLINFKEMMGTSIKEAES